MDLKSLLFCILIISSVMTSFCIESVVTKISNKKDVTYDIQTTTDSNSAIMPIADEDLSTTTSYREETSLSSDNTDSFQTTSKENTTTIANIKITTNKPPDISCTCGIFLSSQFVKGSSEPPKGDPVICNTLERSFVCNPVGQKQCQTKCLQQIVQHLPNSANILCASLDRDIYKEKAFLFVRNCSNKWHNTNLAAGREYCCKNGLPYKCPKK